MNALCTLWSDSHSFELVYRIPCRPYFRCAFFNYSSVIASSNISARSFLVRTRMIGLYTLSLKLSMISFLHFSTLFREFMLLMATHIMKTSHPWYWVLRLNPSWSSPLVSWISILTCRPLMFLVPLYMSNTVGA